MNAHQERSEQMTNASAAYKRGEITLSDLLWYAVGHPQVHSRAGAVGQMGYIPR